MSVDGVIMDDSKKRLRIAQFPQSEEALLVWMLQLQCESIRVPISGPWIQEKAKSIAHELKILEEDKPNFAVGCPIKFQHQCNVQSFKLIGEAGSADEGAIKANFPGIIATIKN